MTKGDQNEQNCKQKNGSKTEKMQGQQSPKNNQQSMKNKQK